MIKVVNGNLLLEDGYRDDFEIAELLADSWSQL